MFKSEYSIFLGREEDKNNVEFLIEDKFYLILESKGDIEKDEIRNYFTKIKEELKEDPPVNLNDFENLIDRHLKSVLQTGSVSLAAGLVAGEIFYLLTAGGGKIFLKRGEKCELIIKDDNKASGFIQKDDFFIFESEEFSSLIEKDELNKYLKEGHPKEILENLTPIIKEKDDLGAIALFIKWDKKTSSADEIVEEEEEIEVAESKSLPQKEIFEIESKKRFNLDFIFNLREKIKEGLSGRQTSRGRKTTAIILVVLVVIFIWSVVFGYQRRAHSELMQKVLKADELIDSKLNEAIDISSLNMERSLILVSEAKDELKKIKEEVGEKEVAEIKKIEEKIAQKENEIVKKDEKKAEEFYDLALIEKGARGEKMYLNGETVAILDSDDGKIFTLSLTKKSTRTIKSDEIKNASFAALYEEDIIFLNKANGVYKAGSDDKIKQVIKKDDDWGDLVGLSIFNGNLYFLDSKKDEIYKYLVGADAYSAKASYFKSGQSIDLKNANSLAIDSSVYVGADTAVYKYTAGARDAFNTKFPEDETNNFSKVFTDANNNKVYLLEKEKGKIFVLNKDGEYEKQIESGVFKKASDFVVLESEKKIYILVSDKIYTVGIE